MTDRDQLVCYARMALAANRYDDMKDTMQKVAISYRMTQEERDLFYLSFKGQIDERRESLHQLTERKEIAEKSNDQLTINVINDLNNKIIKEVLTICSDVVQFLNKNLIVDRSAVYENLFFIIMKGDFYRYIYEVKPSEETKKMVVSSYELGKKLCGPLSTLNELDLCYKYARFQYNQLDDPSSAMTVLNTAILKMNDTMKNNPTLRNNDVAFLINELFKLSNQIERASPFMDTQQEMNEFLEQQFTEENRNDNTEDNNGTLTIDGFDSEMKDSPTENPSDSVIPTEDTPMKPNRFALNLPLKSLTLDVGSNTSDSSTTTTHSNIFEIPAQRKKYSGIQLTPLMTKLSVLAMNEERSRGFSSRDTTPGVDHPTSSNGVNLFRRRSSVKCEDVVDVVTDMSEERERVEMFICGQQNMTLVLLLEESSCQKHELVQAMFDICVSRLTRLETSLNQILSVSVDGDKNEGSYSFLSVDPNWDTLQRCGPWSNKVLEHVEHIRHDFVALRGITDMILRTEDAVVYGYGYKRGRSGIFYKQNSAPQSGQLPAPADVMGTISVSAKLERDHSIILL